MSKPSLLWFDCTTSFSEMALRAECAKSFAVNLCALHDHAARDIERHQPRVLCFEFDYPDQTALKGMQAIKRAHPGLPVLMLTVAHSEALAVWAFRARIWNFLVKPIAMGEWHENLQTLVQIITADRRSGRAVSLPSPDVPHEVPSSQPDDAQCLLRPAVYYIERHFRERCSAEVIAELCRMSKFRFSRLFRSTFGLTFQEYVLRYRVGEACRLLQQPGVSITEVGCAVGFNDPSHFARMFKRFAGVLPSEYVERVNGGTGKRQNRLDKPVPPYLLYYVR